MVMEASPSPQSVGREFVRQYYTLLNKAPAHLHRFYNNYSSFVHGGLDAPNRETLPVIGQKQIHNRIQQLNFRDCHAKISQVDSQATLGNGVVVQVTGELSNGGAPMRRFTQTFVLAAQSPKKYYVHNDIFRYQDIVFSDEEGSGDNRSEADEEEPRGYFPPPPTAFPAAAFPPSPAAAPAPAPQLAPAAPPPAVAAPAPSALPQPHLNGHPPPAHAHALDDARHLVAALQGAPAAPAAPDREPEPEPPAAPGPAAASAALDEEPRDPEPDRDPTPPPQRQPQPQPAAPPAAPEPKTYANLLKSGGQSHGQPRPPPAPAAAPAQAQSGAAGGSPPEQRARAYRPPRDPQPAAEGGGRRYSDSQQLFLGNLPHCATEEELRALFGRFGAIAELRVHGKPAQAGAPKHPNYGFITYEQPQAAQNCLLAAPLYFPADSTDGVKLNVEEKKARGGRGEPPRGGRPPPHRAPAPHQQHRAPFPPRAPYRR